MLDRIEPSVDRLMEHVEARTGVQPPEPEQQEVEPAEEGEGG